MKLVIMRGVSGSGKSTKARKLVTDEGNSIICSADDYFMKDGEYVFDGRELGKAHAWCLGKVAAAMEIGLRLIVLDNTNTQRWEYQPYLALAAAEGYEVEFVLVGDLDEASLKTYAQRNSHGVPLAVIQKQARRFES